MSEYGYNTRSKTSNNHMSHKKTIGEELYQVHLRRKTAERVDSSDNKHDTARKGTKSIGEELFHIHLKRSQGLEFDQDVGNILEPHQKDVKN